MNTKYVRAFFDTKALSPKDKEKGILRGVIGSDETIDRYGEIVDSNSWQLDHYNDNPILLWAHNLSFGEDRPAIGKSLRTWVENKQLKFDLQFDMADEFAAGIYRKYTPDNGGPFLRMFSVGFIPHIIEQVHDDANPKLRAVLKNNELLELSAVPVPANPNASSQLRMNSFLTRTWDEMLIDAEKTAEHLKEAAKEEPEKPTTEEPIKPEEPAADPKPADEESEEAKTEAIASRVATKVLPQLTKAITDVVIEAHKPKEDKGGSSSEPKNPQLGRKSSLVRVLRATTRELQGILAEANAARRS